MAKLTIVDLNSSFYELDKSKRDKRQNPDGRSVAVDPVDGSPEQDQPSTEGED